MIPNLQLTAKDSKPIVDPEMYTRSASKLNYLTMTHPNITYSISVVSQFMSSLIVAHWEVLEQMLCYLKGAPRYGLFYDNHEHSNIECFSNADWPESKANGRSTIRYCAFVRSNLVS